MFIKSNSEKFLDNRNNTPQVSSLMGKSVSQYRKETLSDEVARGVYREGSGTHGAGELTANSLVVSTGLSKRAQLVDSGSGGFGFGEHGLRHGAGSTVKQIPEVYSPLWLTSNLNLPRDRATINAWCRSFYALNPMVHNAINLHSTYPISKLNIKCKNKEVEKFFSDLIEEIDLMNICVQIAQEYWLLGESFVYAELDNNKGKWSRLLLQNPDYMIVKRTVIANEPVILLRPDENLKRIINSNRPSDIEQRKQLNQHIIDSVKRGENIPLENFHVSHLARKISPYEIRGTGLPVAIFRQLMLFDQLYENKFAQAQDLINPLLIFKLGSADFKPSAADLEAWRQTLEMATYDKDFKIVTHEAIDVQVVSKASGIYDISNDITQLIKLIFIGLQVPQVIMDGGADTTYANGGIALDILRQRYLSFRNMLSNWLKRKIFAPVAKIQGFYEYKNKEKQLIIPEIEWNHMSLFDTGDYINTLVQLTTPIGEGTSGRVSLHTLYRALGLEHDDEARKMRREAIQSIINKKEAAALAAMELNELRSLDDDDEIMEPKADAKSAEAPVPGEGPAGAPGGELGGLPGLEEAGKLGPPPGAPPPPPPAPTPGPPPA